MAAMAPWMWFVGFGALVARRSLFPNPIILLILLFGGDGDLAALAHAARGRRRAGGATTTCAPRDRLLVAAVYVGLIVALVVGMDATHLVRTFADA